MNWRALGAVAVILCSGCATSPYRPVPMDEFEHDPALFHDQPLAVALERHTELQAVPASLLPATSLAQVPGADPSGYVLMATSSSMRKPVVCCRISSGWSGGGTMWVPTLDASGNVSSGYSMSMPMMPYASHTRTSVLDVDSVIVLPDAVIVHLCRTRTPGTAYFYRNQGYEAALHHPGDMIHPGYTVLESDRWCVIPRERLAGLRVYDPEPPRSRSRRGGSSSDPESSEDAGTAEVSDAESSGNVDSGEDDEHELTAEEAVALWLDRMKPSGPAPLSNGSAARALRNAATQGDSLVTAELFERLDLAATPLAGMPGFEPFNDHARPAEFYFALLLMLMSRGEVAAATDVLAGLLHTHSVRADWTGEQNLDAFVRRSLRDTDFAGSAGQAFYLQRQVAIDACWPDVVAEFQRRCADED